MKDTVTKGKSIPNIESNSALSKMFTLLIM